MSEKITFEDQELRAKLIAKAFVNIFVSDHDAVSILDSGEIEYKTEDPITGDLLPDSVGWIKAMFSDEWYVDYFADFNSDLVHELFSYMGYEFTVYHSDWGEIRITVTNVFTFNSYFIDTESAMVEDIWRIVYNGIGQDLVFNTTSDSAS